METIYQKALDDTQPAITLIWLHGMGVNGSDFEGFQKELAQFGGLNNINLILPTAPTRTVSAFNLAMPAWFDLYSESFQLRPDEVRKEDIDGMNASIALIQAIIDEERAKNPETPIWLGGFSQGAVISILAGYSQTQPIGGIIALSGYIPDHPRFEEISDLARQTPTFIAHGTLDPVIPISVTREGVSLLNSKGATLEFFDYPMMHEICPDEIQDIADFIRSHSSSAVPDSEEN